MADTPGPGPRPAARPPDWVRCDACAALIYRKRFDRGMQVCPDCGWHRPLTAPQRLEQLLDPGSAEPIETAEPPDDPLGFVDTLPYPERLRRAREETGLRDAVCCARGRIHRRPVVVAAMDFRFLGGSLGCAVGALVTEAARTSLRRAEPLLLVTASGGARMQEGVLSLMQMAKTAQAMADLDEAGILTVSLVTDPTYGGVAASYATLADVIIAEPGARLGFAGPRVIQQTTGERLPEGFQTAEFLLQGGMLDDVVPRPALRGVLAGLLGAAAGAAAGAPAARGAGPQATEGVAARDGAAEPVRAGATEPAREGTTAPARAGAAGPTLERATDPAFEGAADPARPYATRPSGSAAAVAPAGAQRAGAVLRRPEELVEREPWEAVRAARHAERPSAREYADHLLDDFHELHGDRLAEDCPAVVGGVGLLAGRPVMLVGHHKGGPGLPGRQRCSFGMATPGGYRKAARLMRLAAKLRLPVVTLIDTPGAHPGPDAERGGQAVAIAENLRLMSGLPVPLVAVLTGEGGSGGALALAVADRVLISEGGVYSVISPEGCAAILWKTRDAAPEAAAALRLHAGELLRLGVVDGVVPEPPDGAEHDHAKAAALLGDALAETLADLVPWDAERLVRSRRGRFQRFGEPAGLDGDSTAGLDGDSRGAT